MSFINFIGVLIISILLAHSVPDEYKIVAGHIGLILLFQAIISFAFLEEKSDTNEDDDTKQ